MNEKKSLILMVEDEEQVLNTNCRMLRRRGYDVRTAQTVSEACQQIEEQLPDLLILDIMLPDGNGLDICHHFRKRSMNPVLFLTGKSDIRDKVEGLQQGGDYYLTKPYNFDEFLAVIQMLLERQKFVKIIRFGEIIVASLLKPFYLIADIAFSCEKKNRVHGFFAEVAADIQAVSVRKHNVQDEKIRQLFFKLMTGFGGCLCSADIVATAPQHPAVGIQHLFFILDYKDK